MSVCSSYSYSSEQQRGVYSLLKYTNVYRLYQNIVAQKKAFNIYLADYVMPTDGERVLDIGCGPGDILLYLRNVDYVGFDLNPQYIEAAKRRFGTRGRFFCGDVAQTDLGDDNLDFDFALATGVLHHIDDGKAKELFRMAYHALRPGGRLLTFDGCLAPGQSRLARWFLGRDRGRFIRTKEHYEELAKSQFDHVDVCVRHDLLRIPYTHCIMRCIKTTSK